MSQLWGYLVGGRNPEGQVESESALMQVLSVSS
jgi:hypothetical protein